jgi:wyosine [tRNA(Phe)-imidazoG37] synthetase (radical SAM superfamily)
MTSYTFGPVPSRRLGRSLGVDLVPFKTCSYDCIYCQLGRTTCRTVERKAWVPLDEVLEQVREALSTEPDYITLSGSGEPTLFSQLGELIAGIKSLSDIPIAVLTNGSLLWHKEVQEGLAEADLVIPSLDAGDASLFRHVNRPHPAIQFDQMVNGLVEFRQRFTGAYWLEVFLLGGVTGTPAEIKKISSLIQRIRPNRVQLNTVTRPPAEHFALPVSKEAMEHFVELLGDHAEVIADFRGTHDRVEFTARREDVLNLLRRRPCTTDDIAAGLNMHVNEVAKYISELRERGLIRSEVQANKLYYLPEQ